MLSSLVSFISLNDGSALVYGLDAVKPMTEAEKAARGVFGKSDPFRD